MEILKKLRISRRFALQGAVGGIGVSLWLPILEAMCNDHGTAFAQGKPIPTSFGIFFRGNGYFPDDWTPRSYLDDWELPKNLESFAALKNDMTFITGLDMLNAAFKGHGWGVVYVLAGGDGNLCTVMSDIDLDRSHAFETAAATQYQPTIDQLIADALHTNEPFKSLETGVLPHRGINMGTVGNNLAHRGPNDFLPPERDPTKLFNKLFKNEIPGSSGTPADISNALERSVLDAVLEDAKRMKMIVGTADAQRLDQHMESIRALEQRIPATEGGGMPAAGGCTVPTPPPMTLEDMTAKSQALNRLIVAALACNLTRVYTHLWSGPRDDNRYPTLPLGSGTITVDAEHHSLTHGGQQQREQCSKIENYIMTQYADLAQVMKDTPMAAGNVLDHTLLYGATEVADPLGEVMKDFRIVLMGHAGGKLPGNRYLRLPGRKVTELMLTMQQIMGLPVATYGSWDQTSKTMPEILA
jgi:hypothetical protein